MSEDSATAPLLRRIEELERENRDLQAELDAHYAPKPKLVTHPRFDRLSPMERKLANALYVNRGHRVTKQQLHEVLFPDGGGHPNTVGELIRRIRRKESLGKRIKTVWGEGYKWITRYNLNDQ